MKKQMTLICSTALALLVGPALVATARADLRVNATLRTPNVIVRVGNTPVRVYKPIRDPRVYRHVVITRQDRRVAHRLSWYTGVPAAEILRLKSRGYTWREIGSWLGVSRGTVRAAMDRRAWKRFLYAERVHRCDAYCTSGCDRHDGRRVVVFERPWEKYNH